MERDKDPHAMVAAAIRAAESRTDGEIMVITAETSDAYHDVALHWAVVAMLLALAVMASFPACATALVDRLSGGWQHVWTQRELLSLALFGAAGLFLIVRYGLAWRPLRLALTPRATRARRVRRRAIDLFRAGIERRTASRTGVLLYLSRAERRAEIVADAAIHQRVPEERWGEAMAGLVDALHDGRPADGLVTAVERIGAILAEVFPRTGTDPDELPDRLIEL